MRFVKFFIFFVVTFFLVLMALSLLVPAHLHISRVINVAKPRSSVTGVIGDLRTWDEWNGFIRNTPLTHKQYSIPASGKGAWLSSDELTIRETAVDTDGVALQWDLKGGKRYVGGFDLLSVNRDSLTIQWWFNFDFRWYPWEKLGVFVYDRKLGPIMEESLDSLKLFLEKSR
ncbi:SRPBCC family protein [Puia dinghuensis]|uniref:Polyketide cyclase n=1 Tax=Puia dinghuensis TaxID=1792502 RepID=A0A8J2U973_9BACT|nr:SRPBCC family protein [Puia dinghuensis]GGA87350.1 hypothetical protein GCM10011511_08140 [Puia dinghuensis]